MHETAERTNKAFKELADAIEKAGYSSQIEALFEALVKAMWAERDYYSGHCYDVAKEGYCMILNKIKECIGSGDYDEARSHIRTFLAVWNGNTDEKFHVDDKGEVMELPPFSKENTKDKPLPRNADWVNFENKVEAWYQFEDWCKRKYGSKLATAYNAFEWLIVPEYFEEELMRKPQGEKGE